MQPTLHQTAARRFLCAGELGKPFWQISAQTLQELEFLLMACLDRLRCRAHRHSLGHVVTISPAPGLEFLEQASGPDALNLLGLELEPK
jgi:hypothetical protein